MKTTMLAAALLLAAATGTASAGGQEGAIGVGVEYSLSPLALGGTGGGTFGIGGASLNYDAGAFHVGGALGLYDGDGPDNTLITLAGRFYYHVHSTAMSDFGVGGTLAMANFDAGNDRNTALFLEPGIQIRLFVASNVALSFAAGISIGAIDAGGVYLGGQATGSAGLHYYFF